MKEPVLPPLPEPREAYLPTHILRYYDPAEIEDLFRAYALEAVKAERERCAEIAQDMDFSPDGAIASAIRSQEG